MILLDTTDWPAIRPLPAGLPAPARARALQYDFHPRATAASVVDGPDGESMRTAASPGRDAMRLVGRDPGAALAAAALLAAKEHEGPGEGPGGVTLVGLYQTHVGANLIAVPLWNAPGADAPGRYLPIPGITLAAAPAARARFADDRLVAVVARDGWVLNPARAGTFAGVAG